jgi:hypothetical protein
LFFFGRGPFAALAKPLKKKVRALCEPPSVVVGQNRK